MNELEARRFLVEGRVQGVCFRATTREQAQRLGVAGYARNLPDGRVEVWAEGEIGALDTLQAWLQHGPRLAKVTRLQSEAVGLAGMDGFTTR